MPVELGDIAVDNLEAAYKSGLAENMSISASGPTWNLVGNCCFIFHQFNSIRDEVSTVQIYLYRDRLKGGP